MPQGRILLKGVTESKKLASLKTDTARLLFSWIIPNLDKNGNFSGDPVVVNNKIFTRLNKSAKEVEGHIMDLAENKLIVLYEANGDSYMHVLQFLEKTPGLKPERERPSDIPQPTTEQLGNPPPLPKPKTKTKKKEKNEGKIKYLDKVYLTEEEYGKLGLGLGEQMRDEMIQRLDEYAHQKPKKFAEYESHYHTILSWCRKQGVQMKTPEQIKKAQEAQQRALEDRKVLTKTCSCGQTYKTTKGENFLSCPVCREKARKQAIANARAMLSNPSVRSGETQKIGDVVKKILPPGEKPKEDEKVEEF